MAQLPTCLLKTLMRLDVYLAESGLADSRTDAKNFILAGAVQVNGNIVNKPSYEVFGDETFIVDRSSKKYVSRGGVKLECALDAFSVDPSGKYALDIGASSGGFTDCLLKRGASHVIAVDSGFGQLVESLRKDKRVTTIENYNARYMKSEDFAYTPNLVVMDVSFISAKLIFPAVANIISADADYICLIKPQFEVGRSGLNKKGIVKNEQLRNNAVENVVEGAACCGFHLHGLIESPIMGGDGNIEFLAHFKRQ